MNENPKRRTFRFNLRTLLIFVTLAAPMSAYVASYYRLSRRGMADAEPWGSEDWVYISSEESKSQDAQRTHQDRRRFYAPLAYLDHLLFGTPTPSRGWMEAGTVADE